MALSNLRADSAHVTPARAPNAQPLPKFIHPDSMPDRYALTGRGTCMAPLIGDGACCVFDKHEEPRPGDVVGIIFTQDAAQHRRAPGMIKRLVLALPPAGFDGLIVVEQINPARSHAIPRADILAVHKFVGTAQSNGDGTAQFRPQAAEAA